MNKVIYFDMDGTIANLYAVKGWLEALRSYQPFPYLEAAPMWDMFKLVKVLKNLKSKGYTIGVITWLSKESTREYDKAVREAWENYGGETIDPTSVNILEELANMVKEKM